jgi:hypothetical protein
MNASGDLRHQVSEAGKREVEEVLERILRSGAFASSARSREFLEFVVKQSLHQPTSLNERRIAAEVFGKTDFNPTEDSAVRVKTVEVRRRLARYYAEEGTADRVRIELPSGSYAAVFNWPSSDSMPQPSLGRPRVRRMIAAAAGLAVVAVCAAGLYARFGGESVEDRFWKPVLRGSSVVSLCVPFRLSCEGCFTYAPPIAGPPDEPVPSPDAARTSPPFPGMTMPLIGMGDALGLARLTALCAAKGVQYQIKTSNELTFSDLRQQPAVILGWRWSRNVSEELPFTFEARTGSVIDRRDPTRKWPRVGLLSGQGPGEEHAIIARLRYWNGGQPLILGAGSTTFGTQAAAEFLTTPALLETLTEKLPKGWEDRNLAAVVHTSVLGRTPGRPKLVVVKTW